MKNKSYTQFHMHVEYGLSRREIFNRKIRRFILWTFFVLVMGWFLTGCSSKHYELRPDLNYLKQDNKGIMICRLDAQDGVICEYNLDFYGDEELFVVRRRQWIK